MNLTFVLFGVLGGLLMAFLDALVNANPLATRLYSVFKPIARTSMNIGVAVLIDIAYGLLMAGIFVLLHDALPGENDVLKGLSFGLLVWFFRVVMQAASQWVMFNVSLRSVLYTALAGLGEMLAIGLFYGMTLPLAG